jgi:hypothetical protein
MEAWCKIRVGGLLELTIFCFEKKNYLPPSTIVKVQFLSNHFEEPEKTIRGG